MLESSDSSAGLLSRESGVRVPDGSPPHHTLERELPTHFLRNHLRLAPPDSSHPLSSNPVFFTFSGVHALLLFPRCCNQAGVPNHLAEHIYMLDLLDCV